MHSSALMQLKLAMLLMPFRFTKNLFAGLSSCVALLALLREAAGGAGGALLGQGDDALERAASRCVMLPAGHEPVLLDAAGVGAMLTDLDFE
jgi:hypothetical protein